MFNEINYVPEGLFETEAAGLKKLLGKPTLIHLDGGNKQPLFVSTLLHGNETTGFYAIQKLLSDFRNKSLPRSLSIFIGNIEAAETEQRRLNTQSDYNRVWPGTELNENTETKMMAKITEIMQARNLFASIDIHNNTGRNPHYACINILNRDFLPLAGMFSDTVVYFTHPKGTQTACFARFCPSIVLECGQSGEADGLTHSYRFLRAVINLEDMPTGNTDHINLFHTVARVTIPENVSFGTEDDADICLYPHIERMNFREFDPGTPIARISDGSDAFIEASASRPNDVTNDFFALDDNEIVFRRKVTPSMFTINSKAIQQDCLGYLMERIHINTLGRVDTDG